MNATPTDELPTESEYMTIKEVQDFLASKGIKVCSTTLYRWMHKHKLGHRIGGGWYVPRFKIQEVLDGKNDTARGGARYFLQPKDETRGRKKAGK